MPCKKSAELSTCSRSYLFKVAEQANAGKMDKLEAMQREWSRLLPVVGEHLWSNFVQGHLFEKSLTSRVGVDSVFGATPLVTSMRQCLAAACEGQLQGWMSNLKRRLTRLVMRSPRWASAERQALRHQLLWLNSMRLWLVPFAQQQALLETARHGGKTQAPASLDARVSRLAARYVRLYIRRFQPPRFDRLPMQVNQLSAVWAPAQTAWLDGDAVAWLRLSTLERGRRVELPVMGNAYADRFPFEHATTFSLIPKNGSWYVKVVKRVPKAEPVKGPALGIDFGMRNLLATSEGDLFGRGFNERLKQWDVRLLRITQGLQGAGELQLRKCRRYRDFVHRFSSWLRSSIRHVVKRVLALRQPGTVVLEELTFTMQEGQLSARMNRMVRRMGTGIVRQAFEQLAETTGFKVADVNPAYTSQECGSCGFIHRDNRRGDIFRCVCCGSQAHADAQAARNVLERFQHGRSGLSSKHTTLGVQGLQVWAGRMAVRIRKATPGTARHQGAIDYAQAGLKALAEKTGLPQRSKALRETWESSAELQGLLTELVGARSTSLKVASTRYSG